jgi:ribosome-binding protein aMBF1 (putative translation factor)
MRLTPEQEEEVRVAKARGDRRATIGFTADQKREWEDAVRDESAAREDNLARLRKLKTAAEQPGFFGDVRRAIIASRQPAEELSKTIETDPQLLSDFRAGEAELPAAALERLIQALGLRLMQEIPR